MRIYFPGNSYSGRVSLVTLKCKRHRDAAEASYSKSDCWKWLLRWGASAFFTETH